MIVLGNSSATLLSATRRYHSSSRIAFTSFQGLASDLLPTHPVIEQSERYPISTNDPAVKYESYTGRYRYMEALERRPFGPRLASDILLKNAPKAPSLGVAGFQRDYRRGLHLSGDIHVPSLQADFAADNIANIVGKDFTRPRAGGIASDVLPTHALNLHSTTRGRLKQDGDQLFEKLQALLAPRMEEYVDAMVAPLQADSDDDNSGTDIVAHEVAFASDTLPTHALDLQSQRRRGPAHSSEEFLAKLEDLLALRIEEYEDKTA